MYTHQATVDPATHAVARIYTFDVDSRCVVQQRKCEVYKESSKNVMSSCQLQLCLWHFS